MRGDRSGAKLDAIDDLTVPAAGAWSLRLWLRDAAGNASPLTAAPPVHLRLDDDAPQLEIAAADPDHPARVVVAASDATSGVAGGEIEVRRSGRTTWRPVNVTLLQDGFFADVDDENLADGTYDLRARATDAAGNERSTDRGAGGGPAQLVLPLRARSLLAVGRPVRGRRRGRHRRTTRLQRSPAVRYGRSVRLVGRLTTPGANPLAGADVEVFERLDLPTAPFHAVGTVRTSRTGRLAFTASPGPSRVLRFRYPGTATIRARTSDVRLRVGGLSTIRVSRHHVLNGEAIAFRGRVLTQPLPDTGKLIALQVRVRRSWRTFATVRAAADGRWTRRYRFQATTGRVTYRFRAMVPREAGYPYATGFSRRTAVTVRGL